MLEGRRKDVIVIGRCERKLGSSGRGGTDQASFVLASGARAAASTQVLPQCMYVDPAGLFWRGRRFPNTSPNFSVTAIRQPPLRGTYRNPVLSGCDSEDDSVAAVLGQAHRQAVEDRHDRLLYPPRQKYRSYPLFHFVSPWCSIIHIGVNFN